MAEVRPRVVFVCDGHEITHRQMEALAALLEKGSMKRAASSLGISTPVLHKYIHDVEQKTETKLVNTTSRGSTLTDAGRALLRRFREFELRLGDDDRLRIASTLVSQRAVLTAASELSAEGVACSVVIATDPDNLRLIAEGRLDCVVLDDPMLAMERSEHEAFEIGLDMLMLRDVGPRYARLAFGAQRLGFRHLEEHRIPHEIVREVFEPSMVDRLDLSYFVNHSLVRTGIVKAAGAKDQAWSMHSIMALRCSEHEAVDRLFEELREAWVYRKG